MLNILLGLAVIIALVALTIYVPYLIGRLLIHDADSGSSWLIGAALCIGIPLLLIIAYELGNFLRNP